MARMLFVGASLLVGCTPPSREGNADAVSASVIASTPMGVLPVGLTAADERWIFYPASGSTPPSSVAVDARSPIARRFGDDAAATLAIARPPFSAAPVRPGRHPVIIFLPGAGLGASDYRLLLGAFAANGYIVVALHPHGSPEASSARYEEAAREMEETVAQVPIWFRQLGFEADYSHLFLMGHSLGGAAAIMAQVRTVAGAIDIDGDFGSGPPPSQTRPVLYFTGDESGQPARTVHRRAADWEAASKGSINAQRFELPRMRHLDVTDAAALPSHLIRRALDDGRASHDAEEQRMRVVAASLDFMRATSTLFLRPAESGSVQ